MSTSEDQKSNETAIEEWPDEVKRGTAGSSKSHAVISSGKNMKGPQTLALNTHKAGMEGLDAAKINEIIQKASEGSKFYLHKQKCQQRLDAKIADMLNAKASFTEQQINKAKHQMDRLMEELELERDLTSTIVHVDMDMFYAAVEMRDNPSLRDKPMAVGGTGMLSTSNYAARKFGVRAAMPGFIGKKLCPGLIIVPTNFPKYRECSKMVQCVFAEYDPNFSPMSLDEAYLDITNYIKNNRHRYLDDAEEVDVGDEHVAKKIVMEMREKIQAKTQLTASAGIAPNTRLAKICSDMNKPNGQFYLPPDKQKILDFVSTLPIRKVSGIGNVTEQQLSALGVKVCSDLYDKRGLLRLLFTDLHYNYFMSIALGLGSTCLEAYTERDRKSISTETTFRGTADKVFLFNQTEALCQELAEDLLEKDIFGKVFTLKIKTTDFKLKTKAHSFLEATRSYEIMLSAARKLMQQEMDASNEPLSLRLIGVRMSSLVNSSEMGPNRQVTLTHMFSKAGQVKSQQSSQLKSKTNQNNEVPEEKLTQKELDRSENDLDNTEHELKPTSRDKFDCSSNSPTFPDKINKKCMMQSSSINKFFTRPEHISSAEEVAYECPVCFEQIKGSLIVFNCHVDKCLEKSCSNNSQQPLLEIDRDASSAQQLIDSSLTDMHQKSETARVLNKEGSKFLSKLILDKEEGKEEEKKMKSISSIIIFDKVEEKDLSESKLRKEKKKIKSTNIDPEETHSCSISDRDRPAVKTQDNFVCPVCTKADFKDLSLLNSHIDECLSIGAIDRIVKNKDFESPSSSFQQNITQSTSKSSFFGTLMKANTKGTSDDAIHSMKHPRKKQKISHNTLERYFTSS